MIGHDGVGHGAGWFLDKIEVIEKDSEKNFPEFVFPCSRWLDDHEDDKKTERELRLLGNTVVKPVSENKPWNNRKMWSLKISGLLIQVKVH